MISRTHVNIHWIRAAAVGAWFHAVHHFHRLLTLSRKDSAFANVRRTAADGRHIAAMLAWSTS